MTTPKPKELTVDAVYTAAVADEQTKLSGAAIQAVFGTLAGSTYRYKGERGLWEASIREVENKYMQETQSSNPDAKTKGVTSKDGKVVKEPRWKYRTYLPMAWSSAKSVCGQAIDAGIILDENSKKTATEKEIKERRKAVKVDKSPAEKLSIVLNSAKHILNSMPDDQRATALGTYGIDVTHKFWAGE